MEYRKRICREKRRGEGGKWSSHVKFMIMDKLHVLNVQ